MSAEAIAMTLGGKRCGGGWMARCPAHDDRAPSLSINEMDGKLLVYCHAGCAQRDVIAALRARGLWYPHAGVSPSHNLRQTALRGKRSSVEYSMRIWRSTIPTSGTSVVTYLRSRGIDIQSPAVLRFSPKLKHTLLYHMAVGQDAAQATFGKECLAHLDSLRDENGTVETEPRHPDISVGQPWPLVPTAAV